MTYIGKLFPAVDPLNLTNISFVAEMYKQSSGDVKERSTASKGMERLDKWMDERDNHPRTKKIIYWRKNWRIILIIIIRNFVMFVEKPKYLAHYLQLGL